MVSLKLMNDYKKSFISTACGCVLKIPKNSESLVFNGVFVGVLKFDDLWTFCDFGILWRVK